MRMCLVLVFIATAVGADDVCPRVCAHVATLYRGNSQDPDCLADCKARRVDPECALKTASLEDLAHCARGRSLAAEAREDWSAAKQSLEEGRRLPAGSCDQIRLYGQCDDFTHEASIGYGKGPMFCHAKEYAPSKDCPRGKLCLRGSGDRVVAEAVQRAAPCQKGSIGTCFYDAGEHANHYYAKPHPRDAAGFWTPDGARRDCEQTGGAWVAGHALPGTPEARRLGPPHEWESK